MIRHEVKSSFSRALKELYKFASINGYVVEHYNTKTFQSVLLSKNGKVALVLYKDKVLNKTFLKVY